MLKKDEKSMAQPQPIENELRDRYIDICESGGSIFRFRRLAQDSEKEYRKGNLYAGAILGNCLTDLGRIAEAEKVFQSLSVHVPVNPDKALSVNIYVGYARVLFLTARLQEAAKILSSFEKGLADIAQHADWILNLYAAIGQTERLRRIHDEIEAVSQTFVLSPAVLYAYLDVLPQENFAELFFGHARHLGISVVDSGTLNQAIEALADCLIQPRMKPGLFEPEFEYLDAIHQTMLDYLNRLLCPYDHTPNEETVKALMDSAAGKGVIHCENLDDMWAKLGV